MKVLKPDYFDKFVCIPQKCSDNCCTCWQVEIDDESTADYIYHINSKDYLCDLLSGAVENKKCKTFKLNKEKRCLMLNNDNLCLLQIKGGHDVLPLTCRAYPRFFNIYGGYEEIGLSFSCPLAANIIVNNDFNTVYYEDNRGITTYTQVDAERFYLIKLARDKLLKIIAENYEDAEKLIEAVLEFSANTQNEIYKKVIITDANKGKTLNRFLKEETVKNRAIKHHAKNVILRPNWKTELSSAKHNKCSIETDTLKIWLNYFIFRYIIKACEDGIFYNRVKGAIISYLVISALDYDFEVAAQKYSKEIEHNEKNLKRLFKFAAKI